MWTSHVDSTCVESFITKEGGKKGKTITKTLHWHCMNALPLSLSLLSATQHATALSCQTLNPVQYLCAVLESVALSAANDTSMRDQNYFYSSSATSIHAIAD